MTTQGTEDHAMSSTEFSNPVIRWIDYRLPIFTFLHHELNVYPTPRNLTYLWNFGSLAGIFLVIMIGTDIFLAMHYVPTWGRLQLRRAHHARCELWVADPICAYHGRVDVFRGRLHPSLSRTLLRFLQGAARAALDNGRRHFPSDDGNGVLRLHLAMGPDELLGCHRHYQSVFRYPNCRR